MLLLFCDEAASRRRSSHSNRRTQRLARDCHPKRRRPLMSQKTWRLCFAFKSAIKLTPAATAETTATTTMTKTTTRASAAEALDPQGCRDRLSRPKHFSMKGPPRDEEATKSSPLWQSVDGQASFLVFSLSHHILPQSLRLVEENFSCNCRATEGRPIRSSPPPQKPR